LHWREGRAWAVELSGPVASQGYLGLTLLWMERAGFKLGGTGSRIAVVGRRPTHSLPPIPRDWSAVAPLLLVAWKTGGTVAGADLSAPHPDRAIERLLGSVGLQLSYSAQGEIGITGTPRGGLSASARECP